MPIYMDIHDTTEATAEDIAAAHQMDLALQGKFKCKFVYFWHDIPNFTGFCLYEAPDKESIINLHNEAHPANMPNQIIEVELSDLEFFFGKIADLAWSNNNSQFEGYINEITHRTMMYLEIVNPILFASQTSKNKFTDLLKSQKKIIKDSFLRFEGKIVLWENDNVLSSFHLKENAIKCAIDIQNKFIKLSDNKNIKFNASMGLSFGAPVTASDELFGDVINLAKKLGYIAVENQILISSSLGKIFNRLNLKNDFKKNNIKVLSAHNEKFLNMIFKIFEQKWNEEKFNIDSLVKLLGMSKAQLYRNVISLTGYSPNVFIREYRLKKALKLLESTKGNISEIAFETGFNNPSYFAKCFQKKFGMLPSEFVHSII